jgi:hypothetical protein
MTLQATGHMFISNINNHLRDKKLMQKPTSLRKVTVPLMKESLPHREGKNRYCKRKTSGLFQNISTEQSSKYGRHTIYFKEFIVPVLQENCGRLRHIECIRRLKLAALKPQIPQPRVVKVMTLNCI